MYNSNNGFQVRVWGPAQWMNLHIISLNYKPERKEAYANYLRSLEHVLPCKSCRDSYPTNVVTAGWTSYPDVTDDCKIFKSRENMARFIYDLHNAVNVAIGRSPHHASFEEVRDFYETFRARDCGIKNEGDGKGGCHNAAGRNIRPGQCTIQIIPHDPDDPSHADEKIVCSDGLASVTRRLKGGECRGIHVKKNRTGQILVTSVDNEDVEGLVCTGWELTAIDGVPATWRDVVDSFNRRDTAVAYTFVPPKA